MSVTELASSIALKDSITLTLNMEALNNNFDIVRQCLLKIKDMESSMGQSQSDKQRLQERIRELQSKHEKNHSQIQTNLQKIQELSNNVGDDFMKKMYEVQEKTKNMHDFDETVRRLEELNKFVLVARFQRKNEEVQQEFGRLWKLKEEFDRYVTGVSFGKYKEEQQSMIESKQKMIDEANSEIQVLKEKLDELRLGLGRVNNQIQQNNSMIKQIDFAGLLDRIMKFKEDTESKVTEMNQKIKKKVSKAEILEFEKSMIDKLDKFFTENEKSKAEKLETKDALLFLQKKIVEIEAVLLDKFGDEDKDAMFAARKWQCASCTKDLGKYEGKLGQYRPWSVFPCKELDPEKSGGFGYLSYIDKVAYRKGYEFEDQNMDRLNKTFQDPKERTIESPMKRMNQTRASNLISNFGSEERSSSLKDAYFREMHSERGERKAFRVLKKEPAKPVLEPDSKQI